MSRPDFSSSREGGLPPASGDDAFRGLRVHPRRRLALVEEIAADLDALEDELVRRGMTRGEARSRALARLYPGPAAVRELEVDGVAYRRLSERWGGDVMATLERAALALVALSTVLALALGLFRIDAFRSGGVFVWSILAIFGLLIANTVRVAFRLWVRQDMRAADRRRAWRAQAGLVLVAASLGGLGASLGAYAAAGRFAAGLDPATGFGFLRDVAMLAALGLGVSAAGLIGWLALTPSLHSWESFERRLAGAFVTPRPRLVRDRHEEIDR